MTHTFQKAKANPPIKKELFTLIILGKEYNFNAKTAYFKMFKQTKSYK